MLSGYRIFTEQNAEGESDGKDHRQEKEGQEGQLGVDGDHHYRIADDQHGIADEPYQHLGVHLV